MLNLGEYRRRADRLADHLPWAALVAPGVVLNKDGAFQRTFAFRGPDLEAATARPDERRFLLEQLMAGATDEVIARKLGIGLRTVRRRIAELMTELGVDTRFQAGVEAVRRGWL